MINHEPDTCSDATLGEMTSSGSSGSYPHHGWLFSALKRVSTRTALLLSSILLVGIGLTDWVTGPERSLGIFYILPIALVTLKLQFSLGIATSILSVLAWIIADYNWTTTRVAENIPYWNASVRLGFFAIITGLLAALKRENARIIELARADPLTGALNVRAFREEAAIELRRAGRSQRPLTLLYLDIDDFKKVNDEFGHDTGDKVLREIARALRAETRAAAQVSRLGGDEFAVLLPDTSSQEAAIVCERLRRRIQEHTHDARTKITVSMGSITCGSAAIGLEELLAEADSLMYAAKRRGGDLAECSTLPPVV